MNDENVVNAFRSEYEALIKSIQDAEFIHKVDKKERIIELEKRQRDLEYFFKLGRKVADQQNNEGFVLVPVSEYQKLTDAVDMLKAVSDDFIAFIQRTKGKNNEESI